MNINECKLNLQLTTRKGLPIIMAGFIFWLFASICGMFLPQDILVWVYLFGIGSIFPLGILIATILKIDLFAKENPLGTLAGIIGGINMLNIPLILIIYFVIPSWIPLIVGASVGTHFLPYMWIYDSKSYLFLSLGTVFASTILGYLFMDNMFIIVPISLSAIYLTTVLSLTVENKKLLSSIK